MTPMSKVQSMRYESISWVWNGAHLGCCVQKVEDLREHGPGLLLAGHVPTAALTAHAQLHQAVVAFAGRSIYVL